MWCKAFLFVRTHLTLQTNKNNREHFYTVFYFTVLTQSPLCCPIVFLLFFLSGSSNCEICLFWLIVILLENSFSQNTSRVHRSSSPVASGAPHGSVLGTLFVFTIFYLFITFLGTGFCSFAKNNNKSSLHTIKVSSFLDLVGKMNYY